MSLNSTRFYRANTIIYNLVLLQNNIDYKLGFFLSRLFLSRAVQLFEKLFTDNERDAIHVLGCSSDLWGHCDSPLHFAQHFKIEKFISHAPNQKDTNRRLYSSDPTNIETTLHPITISGWFKSIKVCILVQVSKILFFKNKSNDYFLQKMNVCI